MIRLNILRVMAICTVAILNTWGQVRTAASTSQTQGHDIYERQCATCHGTEGRGDGPQSISLSPRPGSLLSAQISAKTDQELMRIIANGKPRTAMPGWKDSLSDEEQRAVLAYIRSLIRFSRTMTPPPPH
ncbi:putative Cytochrome c [Nitrospira sp. KM1]|uniref:c-type cytochrome n=1 Tax=Nitrospira sp. KM1 TaxID=1936990 RepID=UPI0013A7630E|nr:cytochrome c [Nitrospira sp. KM1]BCA55119.1 putative Cytochrome c [Nitrospira sp. KM1]